MDHGATQAHNWGRTRIRSGLMQEDSGRDRVERWADFSVSVDQIWAVIGDFAAIADWHPGIESGESVEIDGDMHRHLKIVGGGMILERLIAQDGHTQHYEIIEGPLPVDNYRATITVFPEGKGARVFWSASFEPTDPSADAVVAGVFEGGLKALQDRFSA
ncbi:MAG: hypothetical protein ACJAVR_003183 [Paracoccaceae bacterium]|jgi:hypothetical protein